MKDKSGKLSHKNRLNSFFVHSAAAAESFLEEQLQMATTEKERKRIKKLLKDFK